LVVPRDESYPALLREMGSPPSLHVRGSLEPSDALAVAIVGSRRATPYGMQVAEALAADLAARGVTIVSGLARGIDAAAHRGALSGGGRTVAVLGSGIDIIYPPENRDLARSIAERGAIVSQFPHGTRPLAYNFPTRNRTIAGLALGVVVVEASERSGALITAGLAADLGREVFAVPGRVGSDLSRGPHGLLRDGAILVRDWADIVQELPDPWRRAVRAPAAGPAGTGRTLAGTAASVLEILKPDEPLHIEELTALVALTPGRLASALVTLELGGRARQLEGQRWLAVPARSARPTRSAEPTRSRRR
jgi:DNA processing protein